LCVSVRYHKTIIALSCGGHPELSPSPGDNIPLLTFSEVDTMTYQLEKDNMASVNIFFLRLLYRPQQNSIITLLYDKGSRKS